MDAVLLSTAVGVGSALLVGALVLAVVQWPRRRTRATRALAANAEGTGGQE